MQCKRTKQTNKTKDKIKLKLEMLRSENNSYWPAHSFIVGRIFSWNFPEATDYTQITDHYIDKEN